MGLMSTLRRMDERLLGGALLRARHGWLRGRAVAGIEQRSPRRYVVHYGGSRGELSSLCERYGSDKGWADETRPRPFPWPPHTYADYYGRLFDHCRSGVRRVFECGIGTNRSAFPDNMGAAGRPGASLRVWRDYFPNAQVYGADIDAEILFREERIETYQADQTSPASIKSLWERIGVGGFDLMVDDGLHTFEAGVCLFEHSHAKLAPGGIYAIEDVTLTDLARYQDHFASSRHQVDFVDLHCPNAAVNSVNAMVVIRNA